MQLDKVQKRKYAMAMRRIDYGVWGWSSSVFQEVTLTTRLGQDQSTDKFKKDLRLLVQWMRRRGIKIEYCGCYELSPLKGLLHWHGLFRIKGGFLKLYDGEVRDLKEWKGDDKQWHSKHLNANRRALGDRWFEIHGAFRVSIDKVRNEEEMKSYILKHIVKDYLNEDLIRNKFLVSKGWCRKGTNEINDEFKRWWVNGYEKIGWMSSKGYKMMNDMLRRWCEMNEVQVNASFGYFKVQGLNIDAQLYDFKDK